MADEAMTDSGNHHNRAATAQPHRPGPATMALVAVIALVAAACGSPDTPTSTASGWSPGATTAVTAPPNRQTASSGGTDAPATTTAGRPPVTGSPAAGSPTGDEVLKALDEGRLPPGTADTVRAWAEERCPTLMALTMDQLSDRTAGGLPSSSPPAVAAALDEASFRDFMEDRAAAAEKFADAQLPMPAGFEILEQVITDESRATVDYYRAVADAWAVLRVTPNPPPSGTSPEWDRIKAAQSRLRGQLLPWLLAALAAEGGGSLALVPEACALFLMQMGPYVMHNARGER